MVNVTHKLVYVSIQHYYMLIFLCVCVCACLWIACAFVGFQLSIVGKGQCTTHTILYYKEKPK